MRHLNICFLIWVFRHLKECSSDIEPIVPCKEKYIRTGLPKNASEKAIVYKTIFFFMFSSLNNYDHDKPRPSDQDTVPPCVSSSTLFTLCKPILSLWKQTAAVAVREIASAMNKSPRKNGLAAR